MSCDILCLGEPLVEFNQVDGPEWRQGFGGDVSNVAVAAARQGARTGIATRLGDDGFGRALMEMWEAEGVDTSAVSSDPGAPTGLYFVRHGIDGHKFEGWLTKGDSSYGRATPRIEQRRTRAVQALSKSAPPTIDLTALSALATALPGSSFKLFASQLNSRPQRIEGRPRISLTSDRERRVIE